jgi:hypothetical protein
VAGKVRGYATDGKDEKPDEAARADMTGMINGDYLECAERNQRNEDSQPGDPALYAAGRLSDDVTRDFTDFGLSIHIGQRLDGIAR